MSADLTHATQWVFDLDNTLYPAECNLFDQIDLSGHVIAAITRHGGSVMVGWRGGGVLRGRAHLDTSI